MTDHDRLIVARCAAAVCEFCANPGQWHPAAPEPDGSGYYHQPKRAGKAAEFCDATTIWWEFDPPTVLAVWDVEVTGGR